MKKTKQKQNESERLPNSKRTAKTKHRPGNEVTEKTTVDKGILSLLWHNRAGRFLIIIIAVIAIVGCVLLVSGNDFDRFYSICGAVLLLATVILWLISWRRRSLASRDDERTVPRT